MNNTIVKHSSKSLKNQPCQQTAQNPHIHIYLWRETIVGYDIEYLTVMVRVKGKQWQQKASGIPKAERLNVVMERDTNNTFWAIISNCVQRQIVKECETEAMLEVGLSTSQVNQTLTDPLSGYYYKELLCSKNYTIYTK